MSSAALWGAVPRARVSGAGLTDRVRRVAEAQADRVTGAASARGAAATVTIDRVEGGVRARISVTWAGRTLRSEGVAPAPEYALSEARRALQRLASTAAERPAP